MCVGKEFFFLEELLIFLITSYISWLSSHILSIIFFYASLWEGLTEWEHFISTPDTFIIHKKIKL